MTGKVQPCGTVAACQRHYRRGEKPCRSCLDAAIAYRKKRRSNAPDEVELSRRRSAARQRAYTRLRAAHPDEYRRYYAEEMRRSERGEAS